MPEPGFSSLAFLIGLLTLGTSLTVSAEASPDCRDAKAEARYTQLQPGVFLQFDERSTAADSDNGSRKNAAHVRPRATASGPGIFVDVRTRPDEKATLVACTDCKGVRSGSRVTLCARNRRPGDSPALQPLTPVLEARRTDQTGLAQRSLP